MAKIVKYKFLSCEVNHGTEENPNIEQVVLDKEIICPTKSIFDANYPIAEKEAVGEIVVDGFLVSRNLIKHFGLQQKLSSIKRR